VTIAGLALVLFFPSLHEAGHGTAFRTAWLNEAVVWVSAVLMLQAPRFFREFHWEHHRSTQDRERDPEISGAPDLLDDWPRNVFAYLFLACGQVFLVGKLGFTLACAVLPISVWAKLFPYVPARARARVAWESRIAVALIASIVLAGCARVDGFAMVLLAWPIAHVALGLYLMAEHTGLPNTGSQLERTRSIETTRLVRWLMWNMPLHAVHHAEPGVPFHAVPELDRLLAPGVVHVSPGYLAFHREALRHALGGG
jgi:fatty acid desaturase